MNAANLPPGTTLRVQLLARDIIVAARKPELLSVRNHLQGVVTAVEDDGASDLISIGVGDAAGAGSAGGAPDDTREDHQGRHSRAGARPG